MQLQSLISIPDMKAQYTVYLSISIDKMYVYQMFQHMAGQKVILVYFTTKIWLSSYDISQFKCPAEPKFKYMIYHTQTLTIIISTVYGKSINILSCFQLLIMQYDEAVFQINNNHSYFIKQFTHPRADQDSHYCLIHCLESNSFERNIVIAH